MFKQIIHQTKLLKILVFAIPLLLYINTLRNDYALDDSIVITENIYVQEGIRGLKDIFSNDSFTGFFKKKKDLVQGGRYRPFSVATFAMEKSVWNNNPAISHLINALIYSLLCLILFHTLHQVFVYLAKEDIAIPVAFISTLIFAAHPVHTEVVANIKGRDELLAVLFGLLSLHLLLKYIRFGKTQHVLLSGILLFAGLLSKENALAFLFVPALLIVLKYHAKLKSRYAAGFLVLGMVSCLYLIIRWKVVGGFSTGRVNELLNNPFLNAQENQKIPTILYTLLLYLKLLVFPHPLTYDYYPYHIALQTWSNPLVIISLVLYLILLVLPFYYFRKKKSITFGIAFFLITLLPVSNLLVNIGTFMNERFLFLPSIGFAMVAGCLVYSFMENKAKKSSVKALTKLAFLAILLLFSAKTVVRNCDWKNNFTLFTHDVEISSGSAKGNCTAGGALLEKGQVEKNETKKQDYLVRSIEHLHTALKIYPDYVDALLLLGNAYYHYNKNYEMLCACYERIFVLAPKYDLAYSNLNTMLVSEKNPEPRKTGYHLLLRYKSDDFEANYQLGSTYGKMLNQFDSAQIYLSEAVRIRPGSKLANRDMGVACALTGNYTKSLPYFEKVLKIDAADPANYINLGITYQNLGNQKKAAELFREAERLNIAAKKQEGR